MRKVTAVVGIALVAALALALAAQQYHARVSYRVVPAEGLHNFSADIDIGTVEGGSSGATADKKVADYVTDADGATVTVELVNVTELRKAFSKFDVSIHFHSDSGVIYAAAVSFDFPQASIDLPADDKGDVWIGISYTAKDVAEEVGADLLQFLRIEWQG